MNNTNEQPISPKDLWEIRKDKALTFAGIATPMIVAIIGGVYNGNIKKSENSVRYVELAITQLSSVPSPNTAALRAWAVELLAAQSPVPLPPAAIEQLKTNALPVSASVPGVNFSGTSTFSPGHASTSNH